MLKLKRVVSISSLLVVLLSLFVAGCGNSNPLNPTTVGELKSDNSTVVANVPGVEGPRLVSYETAELIPSGPSLVKEKKNEIESFTHIDEVGGNEDFHFVMAKGYHVPKGCDMNFVLNGKNVGSVTAPENLTEGTIRLENEDFPAGTVTVTMNILCDGEVTASATLTLTRPDDVTSNPLLISKDDKSDDEDDNDEEEEEIRADDAYLGDDRRSVTVEFEDWVNASSASKDNVVITDENGREYRIVSYDENNRFVTFALRQDLTPGEYCISYNGKGGLEGRPGGEPVEKFEFEFIVEEEPLTIREAIFGRASVIIPKGLYRSGQTFLTGLIHFGYKVSPWTRQSLANPGFLVEREEGDTEVWIVSATTLGLIPGQYTAADIAPAVAAAGYRQLPPETASQMRLLYPDQPDQETLVVVSSPIFNPMTQKVYIQMLGREDNVAPGLWVTSLEINNTLKVGYTLFAVAK